jgi:Na+/citrate or Na+/malate symporter
VRLRAGSTLSRVKALLGFLLVLLIIGVGLRMAGMRIPVIDYPFGGPMAQPGIEVVQPDLNLP